MNPQELERIAEKHARNAGQHLQTFITNVSLDQFERHLESFFRQAITEALAPVERERDVAERERDELRKQLINSTDSDRYRGNKITELLTRITALESKLATAREAVLRKGIEAIRNSRADDWGQCINILESLLTTPASNATEGGCEWVINEDGTYETGCLNMFIFTHGTPAENKFKGCPYCLKPIKGSK